MADLKISELTAAASAAGANEIPINEAGATKKVTVTQILALAGGGQSTYDCVVAASGGDYTKLSDALTAGMVSIFVKDGTYTETGNVTSATNNLTITGESKEGAIIDMGAYLLTLSGTGVTIKNLAMTATSGSFYFTGANALIDGNKITKTAASGGSYNFRLYSSGGRFVNNYYSSISTSNGHGLYVNNDGDYCVVSNNYFYSKCNTNYGIVTLEGTSNVCSSNYIESTGGGGDGIRCSGQRNSIVGNSIYSGDSLYYGISISQGGNSAVGNHIYIINTNAYGIYINGNQQVNVAGNFVYGGKYGIYNNSCDEMAITGNTLLGYDIGTSGSIGIYLSNGTTTNTISGNYISTYATGISTGGTSTATVKISGNVVTNVTTQITNTAELVDLFNNLGVSVVEENRLMLMKNTSGGALAVGDVVVFKSVAAGNEITTTTTAGDNKVFGMAAQTIADTASGYIKTLGKTTALKVDGTTDIAIGDYLSCFTTAKIAKKASTGEMAFAIALEAYTTDDSSGIIDALLVSPRLI